MTNRAIVIALAATAAVVALVGCGAGDDDGAMSSGTTVTSASTTTAATTGTTTAAAPNCSAAGLDPEVDRQPGLPSGVVAMRQALAEATVACDYEALSVLGDRHGPGVRYGFGDPVDPAAEMQAAEEGGHGLPPLFYLRSLLDLPYTRIVVAEGDAAPLLYAWPSAFDPEGADESDIAAVIDAGLYSRAEIDAMFDRFGGYTGSRVLISADGDWQAFVTGD